jgi:hypothetical protein
MANRLAEIAGQKVTDLITVNGIRIVLEDGTWGLVRASSNKPELVVVVESPTSEAAMRAIFADIEAQYARHTVERPPSKQTFNILGNCACMCIPWRAHAGNVRDTQASSHQEFRRLMAKFVGVNQQRRAWTL